jgi:hypothetical protein
MKDAATPIRRAYQRIEDRRETQHTTTRGARMPRRMGARRRATGIQKQWTPRVRYVEAGRGVRY